MKPYGVIALALRRKRDDVREGGRVLLRVRSAIATNKRSHLLPLAWRK